MRAPCVNGSNTCGSISGGMPTPVSRTRTTTCPWSRSAVRVIWPRGSVYLAALVSRFATTCASRTGSPSTSSPSRGTCTSSRCAPSSSDGAAISIASDTARPISNRSFFSLILPRVIRETSSRSSTSPIRWRTWRSAIARSCSSPGGAPRSRMSWSAVAIGASGLRSSWPSIARNSSLRRSASRAASYARRAISSARLRTVMSKNDETTPAGFGSSPTNSGCELTESHSSSPPPGRTPTTRFVCG